MSGAALIPRLVGHARREELDYFKSMKVYEYAPLSKCWDKTGKSPIGTKWIDVNKGDAQKTNYRSRLVAKEFKVDIQPEWFAAPPPTECLRLLVSRAATNKKYKLIP